MGSWQSRYRPKTTTPWSSRLVGSGRTWLFDSPADHRKRGGDVDVYVDARLDAEIATSIALQDLFGALKVDLVVRVGEEEGKPIHGIAKRTAALLDGP
jgi:hypothetical protein